MVSFSIERRRLLLSTAAWLGGAAAAVAAARTAQAFQTYEASPTSDLALDYAQRCGPASEHSALIAQLQSDLANNPSASSMTATCPICGCPITVTR